MLEGWINIQPVQKPVSERHGTCNWDQAIEKSQANHKADVRVGNGPWIQMWSLDSSKSRTVV